MKIKKVLLCEGKKFFWSKGDLHTHLGMVKEEDIRNAREMVVSNTGKKFFVLEPKFVDLVGAMQRGPQTPLPKDVAIILYYTGIDKKSEVIDAGVGCGLMAAALARVSKSVTGYERSKEFLDIARKNLELFGIKNVKLKQKDIYEGIDEKGTDVINLDLPEPWKVLGHAEKSLKTGGFLVAYLPNINQVAKFLKEAKRYRFGAVKTIEVLEREWVVDEKRLRPSHKMYGHTAFLTFMRKM